MTRLAVFLLILGTGSFILPLFGLQFRLAGVALLVVDRMRVKAPTRH